MTLANSVPTNLTPGAARLWQHYLDTFTPPSEATLAVHRSLNASPAMIESLMVPRLTMHQELMVSRLMKYEQTPTAEHGKRYRLKEGLRRNGIAVADWVTQ